MIHVTAHAVQRYQERIAPVSREEAMAAILSHGRALETAARFGAPCVRCGDGMRIVLADGHVTTVLAPEMRLGRAA